MMLVESGCYQMCERATVTKLPVRSHTKPAFLCVSVLMNDRSASRAKDALRRGSAKLARVISHANENKCCIYFSTIYDSPILFDQS